MNATRQTRRAYHPAGRALLYLFLITYAILSVYPLAWMAFNSLKTNSEIFVTNPFGPTMNPRFENYSNATSAYNMPAYFKNSLVVAACTVVITLLLAAMYSYATARLRWRLSNFARLYLALGMFVPVQIILVPLVILVRRFHLDNTLLSLIVPYSAFQLSFSSIVFYGFFRTIPNEFEDAATMDGASAYRVFFQIMLPLVVPAMATLAVFVFLHSWNEFLLALILISKERIKTLPLGLVTFRGEFQTDWGGMAAAMTIASVPVIVVYILFSEQVEKAFSIRGLK